MIVTQEMKPSELKQGRPHEPRVHFVTNRVKEKELIKSSGLSVLLSGRAQIERLTVGDDRK